MEYKGTERSPDPPQRPHRRNKVHHETHDLIVGGRVSLIDWRSQEWMHRQIAGSQLEIFEEADGGNHFMFMENPERFNRVVDAFLR